MDINTESIQRITFFTYNYRIINRNFLPKDVRNGNIYGHFIENFWLIRGNSCLKKLSLNCYHWSLRSKLYLKFLFKIVFKILNAILSEATSIKASVTIVLLWIFSQSSGLFHTTLNKAFQNQNWQSSQILYVSSAHSSIVGKC